MRQILADLVAEQQSLDQSLQRAPDRDWKQKTDNGWNVQETIAYLAWTEQHSAAILEGETKFAEILDEHGDLEAFAAAGVAEGKKKRPQEVIEWWRFSRADVVEALSKLSGDERIDWVDGDISARTFATARLTDTWAHGLDILTSLDKEIVDTPRLVHVAFLGWATLPHAFAEAGEDYTEIVRVELVGPGYARWVYGPEGSSQIVRGNAGDWCRVVVRRMDASDAENLSATGEVAELALDIANVFA
jgi:uncharacterized protein (TIGR03084 family)